MSEILRYGAAACQTDHPLPETRAEIGARVDRMIEMMDYAILGYSPVHDIRLFVFPEFGHSGPNYLTLRELREKVAVPIPNEHTERYAAKAKELNVYIQTGSFLEEDPKYPGAVFNTTCLIGPEGLLSKYRKVNPWLPIEIHTSPHDIPGYEEELFPVAKTPIGNLGAAICYDWLFPEVLRQLALNGAEVLVRVSAYMEPWGTMAPMDWWTLVNRARAFENLAYVVASNQGASLKNFPPFVFPGGSMIVDFDGRVLSQAEHGTGERIVVGPVDLAALRHARETRTGHAFLNHLRSSAYDFNKPGVFSGGGWSPPA